MLVQYCKIENMPLTVLSRKHNAKVHYYFIVDLIVIDFFLNSYKGKTGTQK
jgi:hypothetical protein